MTGRLVVEEERCTGCVGCMLACSLSKEGAFSLSLSRINVLRDEAVADFRPRVCVQCSEAPCIVVCPVNALSRNLQTGAIHLDQETCIGCQECVDACPYDGVRFDDSRGLPLICDLCGGSPSCVEACQFPLSIRYEGGDKR